MSANTKKRTIEIFTAGCPACQETIALVNEIACPSCEVTLLDMHDATTAERARSLGIRSVPAVVVDGTLASCCQGRGVDSDSLQAAGVGRAIG